MPQAQPQVIDLDSHEGSDQEMIQGPSRGRSRAPPDSLVDQTNENINWSEDEEEYREDHEEESDQKVEEEEQLEDLASEGGLGHGRIHRFKRDEQNEPPHRRDRTMAREGTQVNLGFEPQRVRTDSNQSS